jgi:hypothetical protein
VEGSRAWLGGLGMDIGELGGRVARFTQIDMDRPAAYHDALEFPNGKVVLVTRLRKGQVATVLQLPPVAEIADRKAAAMEPEFTA